MSVFVFDGSHQTFLTLLLWWQVLAYIQQPFHHLTNGSEKKIETNKYTPQDLLNEVLTVHCANRYTSTNLNMSILHGGNHGSVVSVISGLGRGSTRDLDECWSKFQADSTTATVWKSVLFKNSNWWPMSNSSSCMCQPAEVGHHNLCMHVQLLTLSLSSSISTFTQPLYVLCIVVWIGGIV